jgi:hypothetical protein
LNSSFIPLNQLLREWGMDDEAADDIEAQFSTE